MVERGVTDTNVARGYDGPVSGGKRSMEEGLGSSRANGFISPTNKRCVVLCSIRFPLLTVLRKIGTFLGYGLQMRLVVDHYSIQISQDLYLLMRVR